MIRIRVQALIFNKEGKILLVKHIKNGKEYYVLPGGGVEYRESLVSALIRELREELGIEKVFSVKFLRVREFIDESSDRHVIDLYYYVVADVEKVHLTENDGILSGFGFFSLEELKNIVVYPSYSFICDLVSEALGELVKEGV